MEKSEKNSSRETDIDQTGKRKEREETKRNGKYLERSDPEKPGEV